MIDTHAHIDFPDFDKDRDEMVARALAAGVVNIITVGTDLESSKKAVELAERYAGVYAAVGIHPHDAAAINEADIARLGDIAKHPRVVAVGETGLDFYRDYSPRTAQIQVLRWQLALAAELRLPVIIHCRQAEGDMLNLLRSTHQQYQGVIHCFRGDTDTARTYLDMGFYLSLAAYIGYPSSVKAHDVIRSIPGDRLLVETDCPFLPPQGHRGERNEPAYLPLTVRTLAAIRREQYEDTAKATLQNAQRLFRLPVTSLTKDKGDGVFPGIRQTDGQFTQPQFLSPVPGFPAEIDEGFAAAVSQDFDFPPADTLGSGTKGLHDRFLGSKTGRQPRRLITAQTEFGFGIDAPQEAPSPPPDCLFDSVYFDDVDAKTMHLYSLYCLRLSPSSNVTKYKRRR